MTPLAARLSEARHEPPVQPPVREEYSDELQRTIRDPQDLVNPLYMSPTTYYTPRGDQAGDESH